MPVIAVGSLFAMGGSASAHSAPSAHPSTATLSGTVVAKPGKNLVDNQTVQVTVKGVTEDTDPKGLYAAVCDPHILADQDSSWCDLTTTHVNENPAATSGSETISFTIFTGTDFKAKHKGAACDFAHNGGTCYIVVSNGPADEPGGPTSAGFTTIHYKDLRATTKTKLKAKKTAKTGSKVLLTVTTTHKGTAKLSGSVLIKDGSKKCTKVKEKASGKVTAKCKIKAGKNKFTAAFSGDKVNYKPSTGKATVTGKK
jgi:hypothetical protein